MRFPVRLLCVLVLLVAACGGGTAETTTSAGTVSTTTDEATTTSESPETTTTLAATGDATFEFEGDVEAGTEFEVAWTGPDNEGDYITIVPAGSREGTYADYFNTADGSPGILSAPTTFGDHEIRYIDGATSATVASVPIAVAGRVITLELPVTVAAGTEFEVSWEAIGAPGDYITIVPAASPDGSYESYFDITDGPTGTLVAPMAGGDFEIRYVSGLDSATMAASTITVTPLDITIEVPDAVAAGSDFEVTWTGPNGPGDYLTIVPVDADDAAYLDYAYTTEGSPLTLTAPEEPGDYEVRYRTDRLGGVFATAEITVE
jgi:Ca-activated chloride channel family protein